MCCNFELLMKMGRGHRSWRARSRRNSPPRSPPEFVTADAGDGWVLIERIGQEKLQAAATIIYAELGCPAWQRSALPGTGRGLPKQTCDQPDLLAGLRRRETGTTHILSRGP
jgi:hypothetical protein